MNGPSVFGCRACAGGLFLGPLSAVWLMHVRLEIVRSRLMCQRNKRKDDEDEDEDEWVFYR